MLGIIEHLGQAAFDQLTGREQIFAQFFQIPFVRGQFIEVASRALGRLPRIGHGRGNILGQCIGQRPECGHGHTNVAVRPADLADKLAAGRDDRAQLFFQCAGQFTDGGFAAKRQDGFVGKGRLAAGSGLQFEVGAFQRPEPGQQQLGIGPQPFGGAPLDAHRDARFPLLVEVHFGHAAGANPVQGDIHAGEDCIGLARAARVIDRGFEKVVAPAQHGGHEQHQDDDSRKKAADLESEVAETRVGIAKVFHRFGLRIFPVHASGNCDSAVRTSQAASSRASRNQTTAEFAVCLASASSRWKKWQLTMTSGLSR